MKKLLMMVNLDCKVPARQYLYIYISTYNIFISHTFQVGSGPFYSLSFHDMHKEKTTSHDSIYMNVIILDTSLHVVYIVALLCSQNFYHCHALTDKYELKSKPAQSLEWYIIHHHIRYISTYDYIGYLSWLCTRQLS